MGEMEELLKKRGKMRKRESYNTDNLKPFTKENAKEFGKRGGKNSVATKRKQREARDAIKYLLSLQAKGSLDKFLEGMDVEEEERTNMTALSAKMFQMAMKGDTKAYELLMKYGGYEPDENRKQLESEARIRAMDGGEAQVTSGDGEGNGVVIYMPQIEEPDEAGEDE